MELGLCNRWRRPTATDRDTFFSADPSPADWPAAFTSAKEEAEDSCTLGMKITEPHYWAQAVQRRGRVFRAPLIFLSATVLNG